MGCIPTIRLRTRNLVELATLLRAQLNGIAFKRHTEKTFSLWYCDSTTVCLAAVDGLRCLFRDGQKEILVRWKLVGVMYVGLRVPIAVRVFFAFDIAFGVAYILDYLAGQPWFLTLFLDLDRENNFPTWYSSVQWFCIAGLLGIFAICNFSFFHRKSWLLLTLPLVFLGLSLDEIATIHERIGEWSDALLPGGSRQNSLFSQTGIWMLLLGVPFAVLFAGLVVSIRSYFRQTAGVLTKLCLGMALTLTGALGIETLSNFVSPDSASAVVQVLAEELCELLGSTIVLWGAYELLAQHGFEVKLDRVDTGRS